MKKIIKGSLILLGMGFLLPLGSSVWRTTPVWADDTHQEQSAESEQVTLKIEGMKCRSCVKTMQKALSGLPGVAKATVDYDAGQAVVMREKGKVTDAQLIKAVEDESGFFYTYTAQVVHRK